MFREQVLTPNTNYLYHGTNKNITSLGINNGINVSYVTPNRNYASKYGEYLVKFTPNRPLRILVLSKKALDYMMNYVPDSPLGKNMIAAMKKKHYKAKEGWGEDVVNRLINKKVRNVMERATYRNLFRNKPIRINANGYTRNSDEMLDLAAFSLITRIAKKMGYDGIKTTTRGTVRNNSQGPTNLVEIVFPGRAPLKLVNKSSPNANSEPPVRTNKNVFMNSIRNQGAKKFFTKIKYSPYQRNKFMKAFGLNNASQIQSKINNLATI